MTNEELQAVEELEKEIQMLKASRAAILCQEEASRNEANRLGVELAKRMIVSEPISLTAHGFAESARLFADKFTSLQCDNIRMRQALEMLLCWSKAPAEAGSFAVLYDTVLPAAKMALNS